MTKNIRTQTGKIIGKTLNAYHSKLKPKVDDLKFKEQYQGRIIDCMVGEVDDNYIETPETDAAMVKLEHSKEGLVKLPSMKGKTILVDAEGNETDTPSEGCRLVSVGENEGNKITILSNNSTIDNSENKFGSINIDTGEESTHGRTCLISGYNLICTDVGYVKLYDINFNTLSGTDNYNTVTKRYYDKNKKYLGTNKTEDAFYVRYRCLTINNFSYEKDANNYIFKISEIGNKTYKQHKTEILLDEPLRSLPNGVCDEIVGNKLIRRVGKVTLTGEEGWWSNWTNASFFEWFSNLRITNWKPISDNITWCSNKLKSTTSYSIEHQGQFNCFCFGVDWNATNPKVIVRPSYDIVEEGNVDQFKEWLKKNNMIILYELAEPIIEELPNSITLQGFDDTTIYIENEITPTVQYGYNALIPYKKELKMQQQEVETNTLDIENNIIPYLMDMEYNLMLMEDN